MFDVMESLIESDEFQREFCRNCPAIEKISGARGSFGVPMEPDEWECPADFCPWDEKCFRYQTFEEIEGLLYQVDTLLAEAGSYV